MQNNKLTDCNIIEMLDNFDLPDAYQTKLSLIKGEKYQLIKNLKAESEYGKKNWWIISGNYLEVDLNKIAPYSITFSNKEFNDIKKLFKQILPC